MIFICYPKCSTCKKAKKWLDEHNIDYTERHIVDANPTYDELKVWYSKRLKNKGTERSISEEELSLIKRILKRNGIYC